MANITIQKIGITDIVVDAIVNAANEGLWQGGGVCGFIFRAAGSYQLTQACQKIGHCPTGSAVITPGFQSKAKYIIHAVGPVYDANQEEKCGRLLYDAYKRSLELCIPNDIHSIAFPLISAGIFGYPLQGAWNKAIRACVNWSKKNPDYDLDIIFTVLDDRILKIGNATLSKILSQ
ncbi:MAG: macro domain-containing protein [Firmicutes bacterium]|nr:macro domain-containing protein [Bacillota bacterium]